MGNFVALNSGCFSDKSSYVSNTIPRPEDFSKALYTIDIGQNDIHAGLIWKTVDQVPASISNMTYQLAWTIEVTSFISRYPGEVFLLDHC